MFGLWYLKEAYSKYRNNAPKIVMIRVMVAEQFMKTLPNCAIVQNNCESYYYICKMFVDLDNLTVQSDKHVWSQIKGEHFPLDLI